MIGLENPGLHAYHTLQGRGVLLSVKCKFYTLLTTNHIIMPQNGIAHPVYFEEKWAGNEYP